MKKEIACGAVVFCQKQECKRKYLLICHSKGNHWAVPKGRMEEGETLMETATREIEEETGLSNLEFIDGFEGKIKYFVKYGDEKIDKTVIFFLAKTNCMDVELSSEHTDFKWLELNEAMDLLTYENSKKIVKEADEFLNKI